ncbi:hypothetical protein QO010_003182 [Caulobacter ginsengisoli]|uniref:PBP domain-containing protein n=1 Tax=Caulobacter ginsengisoli TaxID=400775 RepID=A0ABU0ITS1_9CAUL|nr:hypothetical protein [Caulobacter ginsengisoli]MDQ0465395.1 hypothetical protein [Caulobacter ginsengisoli]
MHRRTLLVSLAALGAAASCSQKSDDLAVICDPDLVEAVKRSLTTYQKSHPDSRWTIAQGPPTELIKLAEADGARILITHQLLLADNLQRTRRAPLENRWTVGTPEAPVAVVVTKGAGEAAAKAFAEWLGSIAGQFIFSGATLPNADAPTAP